jgi:hypothetical protein
VYKTAAPGFSAASLASASSSAESADMGVAAEAEDGAADEALGVSTP